MGENRPLAFHRASPPVGSASPGSALGAAGGALPVRDSRSRAAAPRAGLTPTGVEAPRPRPEPRGDTPTTSPEVFSPPRPCSAAQPPGEGTAGTRPCTPRPALLAAPRAQPAHRRWPGPGAGRAEAPGSPSAPPRPSPPRCRLAGPAGAARCRRRPGGRLCKGGGRRREEEQDGSRRRAAAVQPQPAGAGAAACAKWGRGRRWPPSAGSRPGVPPPPPKGAETWGESAGPRPRVGTASRPAWAPLPSPAPPQVRSGSSAAAPWALPRTGVL